MNIFQEYSYNRKQGTRRGAWCVFFFRIAHYFSFGYKRYLGAPYLLFYHIVLRCFMGFDIHEQTRIGRPFTVWHCFGIAINPYTVIGDYVTIHHHVTMGVKGMRFGETQAPRIQDHVVVAPGCVILGDIQVGRNAIVGASSVVVKDVPENAVVAGNPAHVIKMRNA